MLLAAWGIHMIATRCWLLMACVLQACSAQQMYGAGQAWQHQECNKINDVQERGRCMASASTSYEEYKRQVEAAKGMK
jgi:hypothetical protein